jgi:hypothetical protein
MAMRLIQRADTSNNNRGCSSQRLKEGHERGNCCAKRKILIREVKFNVKFTCVVCQFVRLLGGTLGLAVGSAIMYG